MGRACSTCVGEKEFIQAFVGNTRKRERPLRKLRNVAILLKLILEN
jgi:hypothetical protein